MRGDFIRLLDIFLFLGGQLTPPIHSPPLPGPRAVEGGLADGSALVQASLEHSSSSRSTADFGVEAAWQVILKREAREARSQPPLQLLSWPSLGDVWTDVKDGADGLTDQVGDITQDVAREAPSHLPESTTREVTLISEALRGALKGVRSELDAVLNYTMKDKWKLMAKIPTFAPNRNGTASERTLQDILAEFELSMDEVLGNAHGHWGVVQDSIDSAMLSVTSGFEAAGQKPLSKNLHLNVKVAQGQVDYFLRLISDARLEVQGAGEMPLGTLGDHLVAANDKLNGALQHMAHFVTLFQQAFMDLVDTISNALLWWNAALSDIFGLVLHSVTAVAWRARTASRELLHGARLALAAIAKRVGTELPPWHAVSMPLIPSSARPSAGLGAISGATLLVVLCTSLTLHGT